MVYWYLQGEIKMIRDKIIRIRVTKEEDRKITEKAKKKGLTKSAYLRSKGLE